MTNDRHGIQTCAHAVFFLYSVYIEHGWLAAMKKTMCLFFRVLGGIGQQQVIARSRYHLWPPLGVGSGESEVYDRFGSREDLKDTDLRQHLHSIWNIELVLRFYQLSSRVRAVEKSALYIQGHRSVVGAVIFRPVCCFAWRY